MNKLKIALPDNVQEIKSYQIIDGFLVVMYEEKPKRPTKLEDVRSIYLPDEFIQAVKILFQLIKIRNIWNGDWRPDWESESPDQEWKQCIHLNANRWEKETFHAYNHLFVFKDSKTAQDFLNTFQADLDKIKILFQ